MADEARETEKPEVTAALYSALQAMAVHSQENKSFALYNFLLLNSFLLVAWATLFVQPRSWFYALASVVFSMLGIGTGVAWCRVLADYSRSHESFRRYLVRAETYLPARWQQPALLYPDAEDRLGPHAARGRQMDERDRKSSRTGGAMEICWHGPHAYSPSSTSSC